MRKTLFAILVLLPFDGIFAQEDHEPGVILLQVRQPNVVTFSNGQVSNASPQLRAVFQQYPATASRKLSHVSAATDGWYRIDLPVTFPLSTIRAALAACPDISNVTLNYSGILSGTPNDPLWTNQWQLTKIDMPRAWDIVKPDNTILVGVTDTGLDYTHEDLSDNIWSNPNEIPGNSIDDDANGYIDDIRGWDFINDDNDPQDGDTHGTLVAGVIAARTFNGTGLAGIAGGWQSQTGIRLIGLRMTKDDDSDWTQDKAKEAIDYLTWLRQQYGYTIIANMSMQTDKTDAQLVAFEQSINAAKNAGVIMVASSGNAPSPADPRVIELTASGALASSGTYLWKQQSISKVMWRRR